MTKVTTKASKYGPTKVYEGFYNGKNYNGKIYLNGAREHNNYVVINGEESCKKSVEFAVDDIDTIEIDKSRMVTGKLPTTTAGWMREMERSER